jgi:hypothetical protein
MVVGRICNRNVNWNPNTASYGSVIHAKFPPFPIVCCFNRLTLGSTNAFAALTPWPESRAFNEFGTIRLIRASSVPKKLQGTVFTGFPTSKGIPLKERFHLYVVQMQLVPQNSAAIPDSAFMRTVAPCRFSPGEACGPFRVN